MKKITNLLQLIFGFVGLIFLVFVFVFLFQWARKNLILSNSITSGAYPPPGKQEPTRSIQQPYPLPYPTLPESRPTSEPAPPPGWPTNQPWPPDEGTITPAPTTPVEPFPETDFSKLLIEVSFPDMLQILFPYYPKANVHPTLCEVVFDKKSGQQETRQLSLDLIIPIPLTGPDPGPVLQDMHLSPDSRWLVLDFAYRGSQLIDLFSGNSREIDDQLESAYWKFFTWKPSAPLGLIVSDQEFPIEKVQLVDLNTAQVETITFSEDLDKDAMLRAIDYSADGEKNAVAVVVPSNAGSRKTETAIVSLMGGEKHILAEILGGVSFVDYSLQWSPNGEKLIWMVKVVNTMGESETQLWIVDERMGSKRVLSTLGKSLQYNEPSVWSPDGSAIAFLKAEVNIDSQSPEYNIFTINLRTGEEKTNNVL